MGGDEYLLHNWIEAPNLVDLALTQHPELSSPHSFDILTYEDIIVNPKINTPSRRSILAGEYGFEFIVLFCYGTEEETTEKLNPKNQENWQSKKHKPKPERIIPHCDGS